MFKRKKEIPLPLAGLFSAIATMVYVWLVAAFMWNIEKINWQPQSWAGPALFLLLLVFSATICGTLIFGYPIYLTLEKRVKDALVVLGYTLLYTFLLIIVSFLLAAW